MALPEASFVIFAVKTARRYSGLQRQHQHRTHGKNQINSDPNQFGLCFSSPIFTQKYSILLFVYDFSYFKKDYNLLEAGFGAF